MPDPWEPDRCSCMGACACDDCEACLDGRVEVDGDWDSPYRSF